MPVVMGTDVVGQNTASVVLVDTVLEVAILFGRTSSTPARLNQSARVEPTPSLNSRELFQRQSTLVTAQSMIGLLMETHCRLVITWFLLWLQTRWELLCLVPSKCCMERLLLL